MQNKKLFQKIVFIALIVIVLFSMLAPAIFSQMPPLTKPRQEERLLNGLRVLMWPDQSAQNVLVNIRIHAGSSFDSQGKEGVMQMLADNIFPNEAAKDFFKEDLGGSLDIVTNYDYIQINASAKPDQFLTMLETLATAVSNPTIDKETTAKLRTALLAKLKTVEADASYIADQAAARRLFGSFPYGRPQLGTQASVAKIDFADLIDARGRFLAADNATVAISGKFDQSLGFRAARRYFGGWLKSDKRVPATFRQPDAPDTSLLVMETGVDGNPQVRFAMRRVARSDKDFAAAKTLTWVLRSKLAPPEPQKSIVKLAVEHDANVLPGWLVVSYTFPPDWAKAGVKPAATELSKRILADLVGNITDAEFARAKAEAQMEFSGQTPADWFMDEDTYKLPSALADYQAVHNVTINDVRRVAERLSKNSIVSVALVKPAA